MQSVFLAGSFVIKSAVIMMNEKDVFIFVNSKQAYDLYIICATISVVQINLLTLCVKRFKNTFVI